MAPEPTVDSKPKTSRRRVWLVAATAVVLVLALVGGLAALALWVNDRQPTVTSSASDSFSRYRDPWESAMHKAGVEATFPAGPVDLQEITPHGRQAFSATFTPEEVAALLAVYRYRTDDLAGAGELSDVRVRFPAENRASLSGKVTLDGTPYRASIEAPVFYNSGRLTVGQRDAQLSVEGFSVGGQQRQRALESLDEYLNAMLKAAPGLELQKAEIGDGFVRVEGFAPSSIEHPAPSTPSRSNSFARTRNDA